MVKRAKKQVKRRTDHVAERIGRDIAGGRLTQGALLPSDTELCATYDVSRTILREALRILGAKGMLEARPKAGTFICDRQFWAVLDADILDWICAETPKTGQQDLLHQLLDMRLMVEPGASALAATRASQADRQAISAQFASLRQSAKSPSQATAEAEKAFFISLQAASHNRFIHPFKHITHACHLVLQQIGQRYAKPLTLDLQEQLTRAILNHDAATARAHTQAILLDMYDIA